MRWLLLASVLATGCAWNQVVAWEPRTFASAPPARSCKHAVLIGPEDTKDVMSAGGSPLGTLTMKGDSGLERLHAAAAIEAAKRGGTHYFVKHYGSETYTAPNGAVTQVDQVVTYGVIRVPPGSWFGLPPSLTPEKN